MAMNQIFSKPLRIVTGSAFVLLLAVTPARAGVMFDFAPNGVTMSARIDVGFKGDGLVPTDSDFDTAADTAPDTVRADHGAGQQKHSAGHRRPEGHCPG